MSKDVKKARVIFLFYLVQLIPTILNIESSYSIISILLSSINTRIMGIADDYRFISILLSSINTILNMHNLYIYPHFYST